MNNLKRLIAITIVAMLLALTAGCNAQTPKINDDSGPGAASSSQSTESIQPTQAKEQSAQTSYTMADIKALKNTERFAKNTLEHIFDGTINSKGKIIDGTRSDADENGVFTGKVEVSGVKKNGFSSFYPESWTPQQVVDAINTAYDDALADKSNPHGSIWIGYCGDLEIDMYLNSDKKITTAFPVYEGD